MPTTPIHVIGGGLAGTEAAWQIAQAGWPVTLWEMRPVKQTPAHHTGELAELVCSNSFGARAVDRATGLLHQELRELGSLVIRVADEHAVPAGAALAVDRVHFSRALTDLIAQHPLITLRREEVHDLPPGIVVLATGPLTSPALASRLQQLTGQDYLSFFDASSPIVLGESINREIAFLASRYDKGEAAYLNCPMNQAEYERFWEALVTAEQVPLKDFEQAERKFFEACLPVEELARRGKDTLRFGPLKPVGLRDPRHPQTRAYAVVQLRPEDREGRLWNLVGFQTNLRWGEQQRVFRMIPGLEQAEFVRYGVMHRNTFLNAPKLLQATLQFRDYPHLFAAGQLTGTEGYAAAVAGGWLAGTNAVRLAKGWPLLTLPPTTMMGALFHFISSAASADFQPMPPNFGLLPPLDPPPKHKAARYQAYSQRALTDLAAWRQQTSVAACP
ncbi:MAG: FADH(2)-oxidizing methylenetetrahydrofolate--tRNA-(uracil(54)-C(5))-methyltransferase TrmFO [Gloeomargarita sp. SKYBB_i_bin120]|nr:FADH(2)-oxidizing methylenetetrahydrofolate--tRNA-(uracil(54)-C(5))-methyltransferase TrmFO [Gloeomargarita sp. SKYG98]MCS7292457.1 FADH(2)-oxidizing methylenetetrahydrofolate--tRNA-(uracil(54)-C(5))-methyltransferase TrmFO [Gloeomargarita sp. SKYB120]MDW8178018.1 FADH(2)-oxidizing methylenetetrahydrofolate--tRNA-(uracil(54)-C(5))-methyltransferase TrmFO [Gloeomargarita sp. SKYBB_i_bin120]